MAYAPTEEQEILARTARELLGTQPVRRLRALRDTHDPDGFSRALWSEMARLGWLGIAVPEAYGGAGLGWRDLMVVLEELGRCLAPEPMLSMVAGTTALLLGGDEAQRRAHLPAVVAGERLLAVGYQEPGSRFDPTRVATRAERAADGWRLTGEKAHVLDGHVADWLVVSARADEGITLFLVPRAAPGLGVERLWRVDGRGAARLRLEGVRLDASAVLGEVGRGGELLGRVLDRATIALSAAMLGGMTAAFEMTLAYLKTRMQFGVLIGTFQALKHRAARMYVEIELARSVVTAAHAAIDDGADEAQVGRLGGAAKARCNDAFLLVANEGVQMHGGIGMTDEHDIGLYLKRARGDEMTFGDAAWQRDRLAQLDGY
ncbi:MAG TPA: acyl-CoA dehydrogenase [Candidatus Binatia bacterium]|nr:acyl-CoA dehydrogenase [Candidatus Binatia bacterium]